jgi:hypothetical protein
MQTSTLIRQALQSSIAKQDSSVIEAKSLDQCGADLWRLKGLVPIEQGLVDL